MKKILLSFSSLFLLLSCLCAQNTGIGTVTPNPSAILDITSNSKGLLMPRMNTAGIVSIPNPAKGLLVLDTATNQLMMNMGTPVVPNWQTIVFRSGWGLAGNGNTNPVTNFIGTTDAQPLQFRVNNQPAGQIHPVLYNTALGYTALFSNTSGTNNTAIGAYSLYSNTTGLNNTATGLNTLYSNTIGSNNTAAGSYSLSYNTTGSGNAAFGDHVLYANGTGSNNTATGSYTLYANTTGSNNTATGDYVLYSNTTGDNNTASGFQSLNYNTTGFSNTASGLASMYNNTTGYSSTAFGNYVLYSNTTGFANAGNGFQSLYSNTVGFGNTGAGTYSLYYNTSGSGNTASGYQSLNNSVTGNNNTAIGFSADMGADDLNNATAIGSFSLSTANDKVVIGAAFPGIIVIGGYANWSNFSDGRFKENMREDVPGLSFVNKLRPVTYQINSKNLVDHITHLMPDSTASRYKKNNPGYAVMQQKRFTGFVAQEVEKTAKEMGYDFDGVNAPRNETDHYSISYASFVVPLVKSVQEQQIIIEQQNKKIDVLEKRLATLEKRINKQ